jgi:hypothetical protein
MANAKTITGGHIVVYINSKLYGRCSNFSWDSQTAHKPIYGIDQADPFEFSVGQTKISGSMAVYRLSGDGGAQGAGLIPTYEDIPRGKYFNITLIDRSNDLILFQAKFCVLQSEGWSVPSKGIVTGSLRFEAIDWSNEVHFAST